MNNNFKLSDWQVKKFAEKYEKLHTKPCIVCGSDQYGIEKQIFELKPFSPLFYTSSSSGSFPVIAVVCSKCGYTHFINAIASGVLDPSKGDFADDWKETK